MTRVTVDSELMLHHMPAGTLNGAQEFETVVDKNDRPLILGLTTES